MKLLRLGRPKGSSVSPKEATRSAANGVGLSDDGDEGVPEAKEPKTGPSLRSLFRPRSKSKDSPGSPSPSRAGKVGQGNLLTVSLEGTSLRVLAFRGGKAIAWIGLPFNPTFLRNGFVANPEALAGVIRNALAGKGLTPKGYLARLRPWRVVAAFPSFQSQSRIVVVPQARGVNVGEVINRESRRWMNFNPQEHYQFFQEIGRSQAQRRFFVLLIPKAPLQTFINTLRLARLNPSKIVLKPQALATLVTHDLAVLANIENNSLDIAIVASGTPVVMRSVFLGSELLNSETAAPRLVDELNRTIAYYNESNQDAPVPEQAPLYLSGSVAADRDVLDAIERETGLKGVMTLLPVDLPPDFPTPHLMVNAALATVQKSNRRPVG